MTLIRIYVRSDGAELDVSEEELVSLKSETETARLARIMRRVLGKVERAYGFTVSDIGRGDSATVPELDAETDPRLLAAIAELGREFGPLGVALVAARFTDLGALLERLGPAPEQPPTAAPAPMPELPGPTGCRGSGAPWWRVGRRGRPGAASISPTEDYNRNDPDIPTLNIAVEPGDWPIPDARNLALAILAATEWKQEDDPDA